MRKNSEASQNSEEHYHVHYHYYYPTEMRKKEKVSKNNMSVSFTSDKSAVKFKTPKEKNTIRMKTEGDERVAMTEMKKMRLSDLYKIGRQS